MGQLLLLFFLSLFPFTTGWMDETRLEHQTPVVVYGVNLLLAALSYTVLELAIFRANGPDSRARAALGGDAKGRWSLLLYVLGILSAALIGVWVGLAFFTVVAVLWVVPDRRAERYLREHEIPD